MVGGLLHVFYVRHTNIETGACRLPSLQFFDDEALDFQRRILEKSALSEETFFPRGLHSTGAGERRLRVFFRV